MCHVYNERGREAAGYKGDAGDCVARAIAIASGLPHRQVYQRLAEGMKEGPSGSVIRSRSQATASCWGQKERCGNVGTVIPAGKVEGGERKRTAAEASKAD